MSIITRSLSAPFRAVAIILAVAFFASAAAQADTPKGTVVVARTAPNALLIWDASPAVGDLVVAQSSAQDGMRALEIDAIQILGMRATRSHATRIELRVQYAPTGVVGAAYQASTFANATPLMILSASRSLAASRYTTWISNVGARRNTDGLTVKVTGAFPKSE